MSEVPRGWTAVQLGKVSAVALGKMLDRAKRVTGNWLPYLRNANVRWGGFHLDHLLEMPFKDSELERYAVAPGDLLVCEGGEPGRCAIWPGSDREIKYQKALLRIRPNGAADNRWVMYALRHAALNGDLEKYFTGSTIKHFPREAVLRFNLVLPPLAEQRRLIETVEALEAQVNAVRQHLARLPLILKRFRQSVLTAACSGRLTEVWRADHPGTAPFLPRHSPGQCGVCERLTSWTSDDEKWPESWVIVPIGCLVGVATGATPLRRRRDYYEHGTIPWVKSAAVNADRITEVDDFITETALRETNAKVFSPGTLLVAMYGEGATRGKVTELGVPAATNQALAALTFDEGSAAIRPFLKLVLKSLYSENREASAGGVQPNLSLGMIRSIRVSLPPICEQQEIVRQVEALFSLADTIDRRIGAASARADAITQAILNKAFRGELVPKEADLSRVQGRPYESAEELLARIQADRTATGKASRGRRGLTRRANART